MPAGLRRRQVFRESEPEDDHVTMEAAMAPEKGDPEIGDEEFEFGARVRFMDLAAAAIGAFIER